jgi:hypothetical protein
MLRTLKNSKDANDVMTHATGEDTRWAKGNSETHTLGKKASFIAEDLEKDLV